jgi:hypothetical protein
MQTIMANTRGLALLVNLNWDRLLYLGMIFGSLFLGAWIGSH